MNGFAALDIPPCRRYVVVKATAGFAVCRLILKLLLFYGCLDFTQNLGKTRQPMNITWRLDCPIPAKFLKKTNNKLVVGRCTLHDLEEISMDARKHLIIIKGKDQTDSVASFQFHDGKCEVVYTSAPNKSYSFQRSNVEILPLQKKIDPARVIVTVNGQTISGIDEILDFSGYYRIVRSGKRDLSFRRSEVQLQQNCLTYGKNQETFQYFKETAAAISLVAENGINILSMQYDKIQQVSEDIVLASYLAPQKDVKMPQMPEAVIYPFGMNQSQKLAVERALSSKISIIQGPPGTGKTQTILNIIANVVRSGKTVAVVSNNNSATRNVVEKLEKKNSAFLTAFLGSLANKERFLDAQTGAYPNMSDWEMPPEEQQQLDRETTALSKELNEMLNAKNRIAEIEQEFLRLNPEQHYFEEYYASYSDVPMESLDKLSSQKLLALWMEFEQHAECETRLGLLQKISIMFRFNRNALKLFIRSPEQVIPYLQSQFYSVKRRELEAEKQELNQKLERYAFDAKMDELTQKSLRLFRAELATRYHWRNNRRCFEKNDFRRNSEEFTREYPVVLSTTYSIKGTLSIDYIYDYLIVDEASQVDLATGVLAFSCARNIVIVGDLKQLPNVLTENDIRTSDAIWQKYSLDERYRFSTHSLLSSALEIWQDAPVTLLREHYRCHPKIINFCNQKFYHGQLIVMTKDHQKCTKGRRIMPKIIRNAIRCKKCGDVIESKTVHDFKFCSCGSCAVDGGHDYLRRCGNLGDWEEMSEAEKVEGNTH